MLMSYTKETLQFAIVRVNFKKYLQMMRSLDPNCVHPSICLQAIQA